jgi:dihydropteroate synthase
MMGQGAALVDVGGESTRPGAKPVPEAEELRRLMPIVEGLVAEGVPVSIDTYKPGVALRALEAGARVVNVVTGFRDPEMVETVAGSDCGVVAMHMQGTPLDMHIDPSYEDVVEEVRSYLVATTRRLEGAGIARERIAIDPGIGFGKRAAHSLALLANLDVLSDTGLPVMVGTSRKGFLGRIVEDDSRDSLDRATAVTTALAYTRGARLFRVHDVPKSKDALRVAGAIVTNQ